MSCEETKRYLQQVRGLDRRIQNKLSEIEQLRDMAMSVTIPPKDVNVQSSGDKDRMGNVVAHMVDIEREKDKLVKDMLAKRELIIKQIEGIEDIDEYHVLLNKYIINRDWIDIECDMKYSHRNVMRIHKNALINFEKKYGAIYKTVARKPTCL